MLPSAARNSEPAEDRRPDLGPNFLEPAVVTNVDHSMQLMREETFGPVIAIRAVASADEAVELANDSPLCFERERVDAQTRRRGRKLASTNSCRVGDDQ